ncbi:MAG: aminotransferase class V-fold PLP-dependent enzyme, partial [Bacillota bacterium]|nr:aminotransferase class V-fold PLP-dependent enzyme [Bacillota bacterium]
IRREKQDVLFHVDTVQSFGKLAVNPALWQADLLTISAHKIHGPKGAGALYRREGVHLEPIMHGGDQETGLRPGTENMAGIAGFGEAARQAMAGRDRHFRRMTDLKQRLLAGLRERIPDIVQNGPADGAPHILNVTVPDIKGEVLVHTLEEWGIYISTGSACHSHRADPSHVLLAMGLQEKEIAASLRFSFSPLNTEEEIDYTVEKMQEAVESLRLITRRGL